MSTPRLPSRRDALRLVGASVTAGLAGCLLAPDDGSTSDPPTATAATTATPTATRTATPERSPTATVVPLSRIPFADVRVESTPDRTTLAPGEAVVGVRGVFADPANPTCWPAGEYRFAQRYDWGTDDLDRGYEWGSTVVVP